MIYLIGLICSCIVTGYIFFEIMGTLYEKKYSKWIYLAALLLYTFLNILVAWIRQPILNVVYSLSALCALSYLLYDRHGKNVIINSVIVVIYLASVDMIVTAAFSVFTSDSTYIALREPEFFLVSGIANALLMLCTYNLLLHFLLHNQIDRASKFLYLYMIFLAIFEFGSLCYFLQMDSEFESNLSLLMLSIGFIIVDVGILYLYKIYVRNAILETQAELLDQQHKMTEKYYEGLQERYEETQGLLHDLKKHLRVIADIDDCKNNLKDQYASELIDSIDSMQQDFQCSDEILRVIFWDKIQNCKKHGIFLDINMQDIRFDFMDRIEVTILFANLLDNAIEACQRSKKEQKEISLRMHQFKEYIVIKMRNTIGEKPQLEGENLKSAKSGHHGMGMGILAKLANKYCGNLNFDFSEEYFETKIILSVNNKV